jgi:sugar phosphate isomerase/epimerase
LLDQMRSPWLKIILDATNLFWPDKLDNMAATLEEAVDLLGPDMITAHAKDITGDEAKKQQAAGTGKLDWATLFRLLKHSGFDGPVILHNLKPEQVAAAIAFVRGQAAPWYPELADTVDL